MGKRLSLFNEVLMQENFSFNEEEHGRQPDLRGSSQPPENTSHKPLHHLPRGKAWNPPILKKWWFWPASLAGLFALNLAISLWSRFFGN
jgi:hypothetical protein